MTPSGFEGWGVAIAGAFGGVVRWVTLRSDWREGLGAIVVGAICAMYLSPLSLPLLEPVLGALDPSGDVEGLAGFVVGLGGISLTGWLLDRMLPPSKKDKRDD